MSRKSASLALAFGAIVALLAISLPAIPAAAESTHHAGTKRQRSRQGSGVDPVTVSNIILLSLPAHSLSFAITAPHAGSSIPVLPRAVQHLGQY